MATIKTKRSKRSAPKKTNSKVRVVYRTKECDKEHVEKDDKGHVLYAWKNANVLDDPDANRIYTTSEHPKVEDMTVEVSYRHEYLCTGTLTEVSDNTVTNDDGVFVRDPESDIRL